MERTCAELRGVSCLALDDVAPRRQQIVSSLSYGERVSGLREIEESVSNYAAHAAEKLRAQGSTCAAVHVFVEPIASIWTSRNTTTAEPCPCPSRPMICG